MANKYQAVVVGLGAMGSAAVYHLAKRGVSVLGIDKYSPPHINGSTHGPARIMRLSIGEGAHYTPLSTRSYQLFRELENELGTKLLQTTGMLTISPEDKSVLETESYFFDNTVNAAKKHSIKHDVLTAAEIKSRFPQFKVDDAQRGYFEYEAGFLRPEECVRGHLSLAVHHGAQLQLNETVSSITDTDSGVTIQTDKDTYFADQIIISAGPWLPSLLGKPYSNILQVHRLVQYYFDVSDSHAEFEPGKCPIFFWQLAGVDEWIYGFPALNGEQTLSLGVPDRSAPLSFPEDAERTIDARRCAEVYKSYVARCFNNVGEMCVGARTCLYTATPDGEFVIDRHPESPRRIVCSPCSGHGFKHSAAIGEALAQMVRGAETTVDIKPFGLQRFASAAN